MSSDFNKLYRERVDSIYRFVFFKVSDKDITWDITQECFLKMWRQIQSGVAVKNSNALLYAIARNLVIDYWRQKDRGQNVALDDVAHILQDGSDLFEDKASKDEIARLLRCVDKLPESQREVVLLRYVDDLSYSEIGRVIGKNTVTARVAAHRAVKSLKKIMWNQK